MISSIQFGSSLLVNFGKGANVLRTEEHKDGLILIFDGAKAGLTDRDFVGKLLGKTNDGKLIIAYAKR